MKNIIITAVCFLTLSVGIAKADQVGVKVPVNQFGNEASVNYSGVKVAVIASSATNTHYQNHCSGKCVLYGIVVSSALLDGAYVLFQDTTAINNTGTQYLPQFDIEKDTVTYTIMVNPPVRFDIGITSRFVNVSGGPGRVSLLYLER